MKTLAIHLGGLIFLLATCALPQAGEARKDKPPLQALWPDGAPGAKGKDPADVPAVMVYLPPKDKANGAAVVICPGGGYGGLAMDHEGYQIASWLNKHGLAGIIVKYRLGPKYNHPTQLHDAQRAIRFVRAHAAEWGIDAGRIGILGFSAGGHLASTAGTHFDRGHADDQDPIERPGCRPDFMVLMYPVITLTGPYAHVGSRQNLLGKNPDPQVVESLCNDKQVTKETPPTFLVHTTEDTGVPPENSVLFYLALSKNKVPAEMHIYEKGQHGLGLGPANLPYASWSDRCLAWMKARGIMGKN